MPDTSTEHEGQPIKTTPTRRCDICKVEEHPIFSPLLLDSTCVDTTACELRVAENDLIIARTALADTLEALADAAQDFHLYAPQLVCGTDKQREAALRMQEREAQLVAVMERARKVLGGAK